MNLKNKEYKIVHKIIDDINDKHRIFVLEKDGIKFFYKELQKEKEENFLSQLEFQKRFEEEGLGGYLPKIIDYQINLNPKWILWKYIEGPHLADWRPKKLNGFSDWLEPVVDLLTKMDKIESLPHDGKPADIIIERIEKWSEEPIKKNLIQNNQKQVIVDTINRNRSKIEPGFNHGDFVPWHLHKSHFPKFYLVDYEHCKGKPRYYDLAYFYHRVYTKLGEPKLADKFLNIYKKKVKFPKDFKDRFYPVLASRIIGGFYDHLVLKDKTDIELHQNLLRNFLKSI